MDNIPAKTSNDSKSKIDCTEEKILTPAPSTKLMMDFIFRGNRFRCAGQIPEVWHWSFRDKFWVGTAGGVPRRTNVDDGAFHEADGQHQPALAEENDNFFLSFKFLPRNPVGRYPFQPLHSIASALTFARVSIIAHHLRPRPSARHCTSALAVVPSQPVGHGRHAPATPCSTSHSTTWDRLQ